MTLTDDTLTSTESVIKSIEIPHVYVPFLRSNACPPTEAYTDIQSLIKQYEHQLVAIQSDVEHLKARLADMQYQQTYTQDMLVHLRATLAPIKRLPPEILSEIFEHCLDLDSGMLFSARSRSKEPPLLLGRVCRTWRTVAHATPRLWQDIFVNVCDGRYSDALRKDALPVLQTWLAHSGSLPLHLVVLCKTERLLPGLVDIFETIAAHAARWKTVHVRLQNAPVIYGVACQAFTKCTSLSILDITDGGQSMSIFANRQPNEVEEDIQSVNFDLSLAPLHHLSLSLAGLTIRDVHAPWATLTRLFFMQDARSSTTSVTDYVSILRQCTSLRECGLAIDGGVRDAPLKSFTLPNLQCLELQVLREASQTMQMGDFLSVLNAPRLYALSVEDFCPRRDLVSYHSQLKAFLRAHQESLRCFRFSTNSKFFRSEDMITLIMETPRLTELEYRPDEESSPKLLVEALTPCVEANVLQCLLPCLERFFVYWDTKDTVSMVGDMIEKRYALIERGIARLRHLSCKPVRVSMVYDCMPPYTPVENLVARLEPLCRRGLQVDWEVYRYDLEFSYC